MLKGKLGGLLKKGVAAAGVPLKQEQELQHQGLQWRAAVQAAKTKKEELLAEAASAPDGISKLLVHMRRNVDPAERAELRKPTLAEHALLNSLLHEHEGKPACIGAARGEDSLEDVVLVLECLESDHGADGAQVLRKIVKAVELSLSEGMEDGDAAQVFQVLPLAKALKASPDMVELAAEWLALRPELGTLQQGTSIDSAAGREQQGKVKARRIPARPKGY